VQKNKKYFVWACDLYFVVEAWIRTVCKTTSHATNFCRNSGYETATPHPLVFPYTPGTVTEAAYALLEVVRSESKLFLCFHLEVLTISFILRINSQSEVNSF